MPSTILALPVATMPRSPMRPVPPTISTDAGVAAARKRGIELPGPMAPSGSFAFGDDTSDLTSQLIQAGTTVAVTALSPANAATILGRPTQAPVVVAPTVPAPGLSGTTLLMLIGGAALILFVAKKK